MAFVRPARRRGGHPLRGVQLLQAFTRPEHSRAGAGGL